MIDTKSLMASLNFEQSPAALALRNAKSQKEFAAELDRQIKAHQEADAQARSFEHFKKTAKRNRVYLGVRYSLMSADYAARTGVKL